MVRLCFFPNFFPIFGLSSLLIASSCVRIRSGDEEQAQTQTQTQTQTKEQKAPVIQSGQAKVARTESAAAEPPRRTIEITEPVPKVAENLTVLSPGAEPRAPLRLRPSVGARDVATLRMGMVMAMQIGSTDVPPRRIPSIEVTLETVVLEVKGDAIHYRVEVLTAQADEPDDASARVQEAVARAVDSMRGTKGRLVVSSRGKIESIELEIPAEDDASLRPTLEGFRQSFNQMFAWLPEEPVGPGASWSTITHAVHNDLEIQQTAEYQLVARDADRVELEYALTQRGVVGRPVRAPLPGGSLEVEGHAGDGSGRVVLDLGRVMPASGNAKSAGATRTKVAMGGAPETVVMQLDLDLTLQSP
jgi:tRNA threonylcarbamoyladenosine modification (KEOPS) complex  Pcc1 subunit